MISDSCCFTHGSHHDGVIKVVEIVEHWRFLLPCI